MTTQANTPRAADLPPQSDLVHLLAPIGRHWVRFGLLWVLVSILVVVAASHLRPKFETKGTVHVNGSNTDKSGGTSSGLGSMIGIFGGGSDIDSQKGILKTNSLAINTIREQGVNAKLEGNDSILPDRPYLWQYWLERDPNAYNHGLRVIKSETADNVYRKAKLVLRFTDATHFEVLASPSSGEPDAGKALGTGEIGKPVTTSKANFTVTLLPNPVEIHAGDTVKLTIYPAQSVLLDFTKRLEIEGGGRPPRQNNLITITYTSKSPFESQAVVKSMLDQYVELNREWAASVSRAVVSFVGEELGRLRADMDNASGRLVKYQEKVGLVAIDKTLEAEVKTIVAYQVDLDKAKLRVLQLEQLAKSLASGQVDNYQLAFIADPLIEKMGMKLGDINGQLAALSLQYKSDYLPLVELRTVRQSLLKDMQEGVKNTLERSRKEVEGLTQVVEGYNERFATMPEKARALAEYHRATQVFEGLYVFLLQEKQKAQIAEGSTISNIRVVDEPYVPIRESWPGIPLLAGVAAAVGMLVSAATVIVPTLRVRSFTTIEELKAAIGVPAFGVIPYRGSAPNRDTPAVIETKLQSPYLESIRLLRANLQHAMAGRRQQVLLITSAMPQDGKTSIVSNLAATLARSERIDRVLLIDCDMHRPSLHGVFNVPQSPGLSDYLSGLVTLEQIVHTIELGNGRRVDVIPAGPVPPTPVELVDSEPMFNLLARAREQYTYTLIDTPPYPLIATASVLASHVDRVLSICRLGHTERAIFRAHVEALSSFCKNMGLIINLSRIGTRYGTYGDTYGTKYGKGYGSGNASAPAPKPVPRAPGEPGPVMPPVPDSTDAGRTRPTPTVDRPSPTGATPRK